MTTPHTPPAALDVAAIEARAAAATPDAVTYSYEGLTRGEDPRHQFSICNGTWEDEPTRPHRCIAMVYSDSEDSAPDAEFYANARRDVFMLLAHVRRLTAALAPRSAADLAAIEARAAEYERAGVADVAGEVGARERWGSAAHASAADVPALLARIAAARERHAAEVAAARAEALREAEDACRKVAAGYVAESATVPKWEGAIECTEAVAALAAPRDAAAGWLDANGRGDR